MDLHVRVGGVKRSQHGGFCGAGVSVPLRRSATACQQDKRKLSVRRLSHGSRRVEEKFCPAVRVEELSVSKQAPFLEVRSVKCEVRIGGAFTRSSLSPRLTSHFALLT